MKYLTTCKDGDRSGSRGASGAGTREGGAVKIKRDELIECRACGGCGFWMAPVYHNERVRETCGRCNGRGRERIATREVQACEEPFPKAAD